MDHMSGVVNLNEMFISDDRQPLLLVGALGVAALFSIDDKDRTFNTAKKIHRFRRAKRVRGNPAMAGDQISRPIWPEHSVSSPNAPRPMPVHCSDAGLFVGVAWRLPSHCYIDGNDCGHDREARQSISPYAAARLKNSCPRHRCLRST